MKRNKRRKIWYILQFLLPGLLGTVIFYLFPFADVLRRSFLRSSQGKFVGLDNYQQVFQNQAFWRAVRNTGIYVGIGVPVLMLLSLTAALLLRRVLRNRPLLMALLLPMAIPAAVMVLILQLITDGNGLWNGMLAGIEQLLSRIPVVSFPAGNPHMDHMNTHWALVVVLLAFWWKNIGYMTVLWLTGLAALPKEVEEAAAVDGAGRWTRLVFITVPQLAGSFFVIFMLSILQSFKSYREIWMTAGNYPQEDIYLLQHLLQNWYLKLEFDRMAALTVLLALFLFIFCFLVQRQLEKE